MANAAPTTSNSTHNTNEDTGYVLSVSDFNFVDSDGGNTLQAVQITVPPTIGTLRLKGVNVAIDQVISIADINAGYLVFTPAANASGNNYSTFGFKVSDGTAWSASAASLKFNVSAVNDAPTFVIGTGKLMTSISGSDDVANSVKVQADGKILLGGTSYSDDFISSKFALVRYHSDGSLDTSFSSDGMLNTVIGDVQNKANSVMLQADGKILMGGSSSSTDENGHFSLVRYNTDGSLDTSFSTDGMLTTQLGGNFEQANSVMVQDDGRILLAGQSNRDDKREFALVRYNTDGSLDTNFGVDGMLSTAIGGLSSVATIAVLQPDGKILLGGYTYSSGKYDFALARYNNNGSLDTSFSTDGMLTTDIGGRNNAASCIALQADGKILLGGYSHNGSNYEFALVRYNGDGSLDTSFSTDGIVTKVVGIGFDMVSSVTVQSDSKILLGGYSRSGAEYHFTLLRYNSDGSLDTSFGSDGMLTTSIGDIEDGANTIEVQADGKILLGGFAFNDNNHKFGLVRYNSDGSLDTTFNPSNTSDATPTFTSGGNAIVLDSNVQITDQELIAANNFAGSSLTLARNGGANPHDVFAGSGSLQLNGGRVIVNGIDIGSLTNAGGSLNMAFNANATQTLVNAAFQQITYSNNGNDSGSAEIVWRFNDGSGTGNAIVQGSTFVTLISNTVPTINGTQVGQAVISTHNIQPFKMVAVSDPDIGELETATITLDNPLKGSFTANSMALAGFYTNDGGVSYLHDAVSPAAMQAAIRALVFQPNPSRLALNTSETTTFTITVQDQHGGTAINSTTTVITTSVNTAPTNISLSDAFVAQSEGSNATVGLLSATDNNVGDTHTFTLTTPNAGNDNAKFSIVGNSLKVINPGSMTEKNYYVTVQATDANGLSFMKKLTISLDDDIAPFISSIETLRSPRPTVTTGSFIVKFNENVTGVTLDDFFLSSGSGATAHLSSITALSGSAYRVYIDQIVGTGSLNLNLKTSGTGIADLFGNSLPGSMPPVPPVSNDMLVGIHLQQDVFM